MNTLYLDCFSGIAGDMTLAALIDLGADLTYIRHHLKQLPIDPFEMDVISVMKQGIAAKQLQLQIAGEVNHHHHDHRHAAEILAMIEQSELPARVRQRSSAIFEAIAEAEGKIHGIDPSKVHFHEVGAMDSIIDTIGVCLALESLGIDKIIASPVATGQGYAQMAHGLYPIPAPATLELLTGIPLAQLEVQGELTTPTGAGILKALATEFTRQMPSTTVIRVAYGAGTKDFAHPNVLRVLLLKKEEKSNQESIFSLEAQVDDMTGEALGYTMDALFSAGALDVYYTSIYMKKNRPATLITVITHLEKADDCERVMLEETTTLGVRRSACLRTILDRRSVQVQTPYGEITVKQALREGQVCKQAPEYEDVAKAAKHHGVSFLKVYGAVLKII